MTELQSAMCKCIGVFHKYAGQEGDKNSLTKAELKDLLNKEMGDVFGKASDKSKLDEIFQGLDVDKSGTLDFMEYMAIVCSITVLCNECFSKM